MRSVKRGVAETIGMTTKKGKLLMVPIRPPRAVNPSSGRGGTQPIPFTGTLSPAQQRQPALSAAFGLCAGPVGAGRTPVPNCNAHLARLICKAHLRGVTTVSEAKWPGASILGIRGGANLITHPAGRAIPISSHASTTAQTVRSDRAILRKRRLSLLQV
jgi:hypothetical protein